MHKGSLHKGSLHKGSLHKGNLRSPLASFSLGCNAEASSPMMVPSTYNRTRIYENFLTSATYADVLATKHQSVGQSCKQMAKLNSLVAKYHNPSIDLHKDYIIREKREGAACEV